MGAGLASFAIFSAWSAAVQPFWSTIAASAATASGPSAAACESSCSTTAVAASADEAVVDAITAAISADCPRPSEAVTSAPPEWYRNVR